MARPQKPPSERRTEYLHLRLSPTELSAIERYAAEAGVTAGTDVTIRPFDTPVIGRQIGIAWRAGSPREDEARMIGDSVRQTLGERVA